jgi:hypothetical protein
MSYLNKPRKGMLLGGVWDWITGAADTVNKYSDLAKTGVAALSTYASYKDQKAKNELQQAAYDDYMRAAAAAGKEAEAAIDLNLTPMTISGVPTTKAEVTDYTAATGLKHGGISSLRRGYAEGPSEVEVMETDEEVITPDYLMKEEGVKIEPQVFYNTGRGDRANALLIWDQMSTPDKSIFDFDFEIFFQDGGWRDMIKGEAPMSQGQTQMASAPSMGDSQNEAAMQLFNKPYDQLNEMELQMFQEEMSKYMATGGIAGLRKKYAYGPDVEDVEMMDEEFVGDNELKMEEGVQIGPMAGPDWYIKRIEHLEYLGYSYEEAAEIAFDSDKYYSIVGMESAIPKGGEDSKGIMMSYGGGPGIEALRKVKPDVVEKMGFERGGRIGYAMGPGPVMSNTNDGIMDMGGMEKDYRFSGGFVPIGEYEKKDDVPARLSKNEFVFTADAVRAAGGGSINKGAKRMYETMKNLEAQPTAKRMIA